MKHVPRTSLPRRLGALALSLLLLLPTAYASAGEEKLRTEYELADGLTYVNTITSHPAGGRVESYALELSDSRDVLPITLQSSGTLYSGATIGRAVEQAEGLGYRVLGAVNSDFFAMSTGVPMGIVVEDGVYKSSPEGRTALTITDGTFALVEQPQVTITLTNASTGQETALTHLNKWRSAGGGLYLLNEYFSTVSTRTSTDGWMVRMVPLDSEAELSVSGQMELEVTELLEGSEAAPIGEDNYILTADKGAGMESVFKSFQVGDIITLTTQCSPELEDAQWACGAGDVLIRDGQVTDSSAWAYAKDGRNPRTALGVKRDGTTVLYAVDGRQSGYSAGLSEADLANELLEQGCQWAVNLDGGGSTTMSVWVPGQAGPAIVNRPSEGKARSCATYLLLVTEETGSGRPERLALKNDGLVVLAGTSVDLGEVAVLDDALNLLDEQADDVTIRSQDDLGEVDGTIYTAGDRAGTDTFTLRSRDLDARGTAQIHVVTELTELAVTKAGESGALTSLSVKPGEQVALAATGQFWSRTAMRDVDGVTWSVQGDVGSVDEFGVFTAADGGASGTITAQAGGLTKTIPVALTGIHLDVTEEHWAFPAVEYCYSNGLVSGVTPTEFGPSQQIRRGDFLLMLYRAAGQPAVTTTADFPDLSAEDYYYTAISWAVENSLASGMDDGTFAPRSNVTREQAFVILNRVLPILGIHLDSVPAYVLDQFKDRADLASWAADHAAPLVAYQIVSGSDGRLNPKGELSRAEMAALLYKLGSFDPAAVTPVIPDLPADAVTGVVSGASTLNVRSGPGTSYEVLGRLAEGDTVTVLERLDSGWLRIQFPGAPEGGYVSADYVAIQG